MRPDGKSVSCLDYHSRTVLFPPAKANGKLPQVDYFDARTPGLALRVTSSGHKAWSFLFTASNGKRARVGLGTYPGTSLAMARTKATEARGIAEAGEDPRSVFSAQA